MARPMPRAAPVTTTTLPSTRPLMAARNALIGASPLPRHRAGDRHQPP
jgi:hypothetical protein